MAELPTYTCQKIYMGNGKEASHFRKNISCRVFCFGKSKQNIYMCLKFWLFWTQLADLIHDLVGYFLIDSLEPIVGTVFSFFAKFFEFKRFSVTDDDFDRLRKNRFSVVGFIGTKNTDRDDRNAGFDNS